MKRVGAVILAAGASTRLGEPKQLARVQGERLLERAVRVAVEAGCEPVIVVLGAEADRIQGECELGSARIVLNEAWSEGMASSLRSGVAAVAGLCDAAVVMSCDQPAVTADHVRELVRLCGVMPVASSYAGQRGVPACFPASCFAELSRLNGDGGAKELLRDAPAVELAGGELDVDTPAGLKAVRSVYR